MPAVISGMRHLILTGETITKDELLTFSQLEAEAFERTMRGINHRDSRADQIDSIFSAYVRTQEHLDRLNVPYLNPAGEVMKANYLIAAALEFVPQMFGGGSGGVINYANLAVPMQYNAGNMIQMIFERFFGGSGYGYDDYDGYEYNGYGYGYNRDETMTDDESEQDSSHDSDWGPNDDDAMSNSSDEDMDDSDEEYVPPADEDAISVTSDEDESMSEDEDELTSSDDGESANHVEMIPRVSQPDRSINRTSSPMIFNQMTIFSTVPWTTLSKDFCDPMLFSNFKPLILRFIPFSHRDITKPFNYYSLKFNNQFICFESFRK